MQYVYIEDTVFSSFIIDYLLISLSINMTQNKIKFWQKVAGSVFSVTCSIVMSIVDIHNVFLIFIKLFIGIGVSIICVERFCRKELCIFYIVFILFSFLMSGALSVMQALFFLPISPLIAMTFIFIFSIIIKRLIKRFYYSRRINQFSYYIKIRQGERTLNIKAYLDSGNLAIDPLTSSPIVILDFDTFSRLFNISIVDYLSRSIKDRLRGRYIHINGINSSNEMFVVKVDEMYILKQGSLVKIDALVGLSLTSHFASNHHALLSPLIL